VSLFFAKIAGWFVKNPAVIILTVALTAMTVVALGKASDASFFKAQSAEKDKRIEKLAHRVGVADANVATLTKSISVQNDAIDALAKATAESDSQFAASFGRLEAGRAATSAAVAALMKRTAPEDKCAGAFALVREFAK